MPLSMFIANIQDVDLLNMNQTQVVCSIESALEYDIPPSLVLAVADLEGGKANSRVKNSNGTEDLGYMQINTVFLKDLNTRFGTTEEDVMRDDCTSFKLASWRIANHLKNDSGSLLEKVANYHSKTEVYNTIYQSNLLPRITKWIMWQKKNNILYSSDFEELIARQEYTDQPSWMPSGKVVHDPVNVTPKNMVVENKTVRVNGNKNSYIVSFEEAVKNRNISIPINF